MHDYLIHYGVLGMKWGVRRYQNTDGSLTAAGKERYSSKNSKSEIETKQTSWGRTSIYKNPGSQKKKKEIDKNILDILKNGPNDFMEEQEGNLLLAISRIQSEGESEAKKILDETFKNTPVKFRYSVEVEDGYEYAVVGLEIYGDMSTLYLAGEDGYIGDWTAWKNQ